MQSNILPACLRTFCLRVRIFDRLSCEGYVFMTHLGAPAGWGASAIYRPRGTARRVSGCPPNTDILVLASLSFGLRRRLSAEGFDLLTSAPDSTKTFNLPTRFSATTKALQRRALYRSELPFLWQGPMENSTGARHCLAACFEALERRRLSVAIAIGCLVASSPVFATHFSPSPPYPLKWTVIPPTSISLSSSLCHLSSRFLHVIKPRGSRATDIKWPRNSVTSPPSGLLPPG